MLEVLAGTKESKTMLGEDGKTLKKPWPDFSLTIDGRRVGRILTSRVTYVDRV